jgi:RNA-directed DNA polymerase
MSSGSYYPPAVKAVEIPKKSGGIRVLGVPTVADRIAQMVVKLELEPKVEPIFHEDSYAYRLNKSALDAVGITRERCWKHNWVIEYDIKGLFDNIDHELMMKAVEKHTDNRWVRLYIKRWLVAPMQEADGSLIERTKGTPQGGVISPLLSNLFLHYVNDVWLCKNYPKNVWCRFADDGVIHCQTEKEAKEILERLKERYMACKLELHEGKTKIVYCKDGSRKGKHEHTKFVFLGYEFRCRTVRKVSDNSLFQGFVPAVSKEACQGMRKTIRENGVLRRTEVQMEDIAKAFNPILRGWINYYGKYHTNVLERVLKYFNLKLARWCMRKYKKLRGKMGRSVAKVVEIAQANPDLFTHWRLGVIGVF